MTYDVCVCVCNFAKHFRTELSMRADGVATKLSRPGGSEIRAVEKKIVANLVQMRPDEEAILNSSMSSLFANDLLHLKLV